MQYGTNGYIPFKTTISDFFFQNDLGSDWVDLNCKHIHLTKEQILVQRKTVTILLINK